MFRMVFPFVDSAMVIFAIWRTLHGVWQVYYLRPSAGVVIGWILTRALVLLVFYVFAFRAGVLFYLWGSFVKAAFFMVENRAQNRITLNARRVGAGLLVTTIVGLVPFVIHSYREWAKYDDLERLCRYAFTGTSITRGRAAQYARDADFDVERLRPLLLEGNRNTQQVAFEILYARKNPDDVRRFRDILERYNDPDFKPLESDLYYLASRIAGVCGQEVDTKAELRQWLAATPFTGSEDEAASGTRSRQTEQ